MLHRVTTPLIVSHATLHLLMTRGETDRRQEKLVQGQSSRDSESLNDCSNDQSSNPACLSFTSFLCKVLQSNKARKDIQTENLFFLFVLHKNFHQKISEIYVGHFLNIFLLNMIAQYLLSQLPKSSVRYPTKHKPTDSLSATNPRSRDSTALLLKYKSYKISTKYRSGRADITQEEK